LYEALYLGWRPGPLSMLCEPSSQMIAKATSVMWYFYATGKIWCDVLYQHIGYVIQLSKISIKKHFQTNSKGRIKISKYSDLWFNGICIYVATSFAFCALSCELLSVRFFYYTVIQLTSLQFAEFTVCHKSYLFQSKRINFASRWCGTIIRLNIVWYFLTLLCS
jgi:hypothetical protein